MKNNTPSKSKQFFFVFFLFISLLVIAHSCKKSSEDESRSDIFSTYQGNNELVLKVIAELKKPGNKSLLSQLNNEMSVDWVHYKPLITSGFLQGITVRFFRGNDSNYFDAQQR